MTEIAAQFWITVVDCSGWIRVGDELGGDRRGKLFAPQVGNDSSCGVCGKEDAAHTIAQSVTGANDRQGRREQLHDAFGTVFWRCCEVLKIVEGVVDLSCRGDSCGRRVNVAEGLLEDGEEPFGTGQANSCGLKFAKDLVPCFDGNRSGSQSNVVQHHTETVAAALGQGNGASNGVNVPTKHVLFGGPRGVAFLCFLD